MNSMPLRGSEMGRTASFMGRPLPPHQKTIRGHQAGFIFVLTKGGRMAIQGIEGIEDLEYVIKRG